MSLGNKILELRKKNGFSQEQLGEKVDVTRQTISNWELGETTPNPEQLKRLSHVLNISIDELLDNNVGNVLVEKVSNTEKLAGIIIRILKVIGILFAVLMIIDIMAFIMFTTFRKDARVEYTESVELFCSLNNQEYIIEVGSDGYFNCSNCSSKLQKELKDNYIDYGDLSKTEKSISGYFKDNHGTCEK